MCRCVEESLVAVMDLCVSNLNSINQELSTATLTPNTNFKVRLLFLTHPNYPVVCLFR